MHTYGVNLADLHHICKPAKLKINGNLKFHIYMVGLGHFNEILMPLN